MRTLSSSQPSANIWQIYDGGKTVAKTRRVIGHRVAILEHAETDGDEERGETEEERENGEKERMDRESERKKDTRATRKAKQK